MKIGQNNNFYYTETKFSLSDCFNFHLIYNRPTQICYKLMATFDEPSGDNSLLNNINNNSNFGENWRASLALEEDQLLKQLWRRKRISCWNKFLRFICLLNWNWPVKMDQNCKKHEKWKKRLQNSPNMIEWVVENLSTDCAKNWQLVMTETFEIEMFEEKSDKF